MSVGNHSSDSDDTIDTTDTDTEIDTESSSDTENDTRNSSSDEDDADDGEPVPLVIFERSDDFEARLKLTVNDTAIQALKESCGTRSVCVLAILGIQRTGKSFLMNCVKEKLAATMNEDDSTDGWYRNGTELKGFEWKHGLKPVTRGIFVWSKPFILKDKQRKEVSIILIDTQGISEESDDDERIAVIGMSVLLSSICILNVSNEIPQELVSWLQVFAKFGRLNKDSGFSKPLQKLLFVIRDWTRYSEQKLGSIIDERKNQRFLKKLLSSQKKETRKEFKLSWNSIEFFFLPYIGTKALMKDFQGEPQKLSLEFRSHLKGLVYKLANDIPNIQKVFLEESVNFGEYCFFIQSYINVFNNASYGALGLKPEMLMMAMLEGGAEVNFNAGLHAYNQIVRDENNSTFFLHDCPGNVKLLHEQAKTFANAAFQRLGLPTTQLAESKTRLMLSIEGKFETSMKLAREKLDKEVIKCIHQTMLNLECSLEEIFSFNTPGIFYDECQLTSEVEKLVQNAKDDFLSQFESELDSMPHIQDKLAASLDPLAADLIQKNSSAYMVAVTRTDLALKGLVDEYSQKVQSFINEHPKVEAKMFLAWCKRDSEDAFQSFRTLELGNEVFRSQKQQLLMDEINRLNNQFLASLESTLLLARNITKEKVEKFKQSFLSFLTENSDDDLYVNWRENEIDALLQQAEAEYLFKSDSEVGLVLINNLRRQLISAYEDLLEEVSRNKDKLDELEKMQIKKLKDLEIKILALLEEKHFLASEEFDSVMQRLKNRYVSEYVECLATSDADTVKVQGCQDDFSSKVDNLIGNYRLINKSVENEITTFAEGTKKTVLESFRSNIYLAISKLHSLEDLKEEHKFQVNTMVEKFRTLLATKNENFMLRCVNEIITHVEQQFGEIENYFKGLSQSKQTLVRRAQAEYTENMNNVFSNITRAFSEAEMYNYHIQTLERVNAKFTSEELTNEEKYEVRDKLEQLYTEYKKKNDLVFYSFEGCEPAIGIDLGTTYCCIAIYAQGKLQVIRNSTSGDLTTPSYVRINEDDSMVFGQTAKDLAHQYDSDLTIFDAKRLIGRRMDDPCVQADSKSWPFNVVDNDGGPKFLINKKYYYPEEISSFILKHLKEEAETLLGKTVRKAIITVPAYFTDGQRQATVYAGELAELEVLGIINEPTAAAVAYKMHTMHDITDRNILVYDLGGGTFDVAVLNIERENINVLAVEGNSHLGGEDFDYSLMRYCANEFLAKTGTDIFENMASADKVKRDEAKRSMRRLQTQCEVAKRALSVARVSVVSIDNFLKTSLIVEIKQTTFEDLIRPFIEKTIAVVNDALKSANLTKDQIDEILLVGGSTKIPLVRKQLQKHFNGKTLSHSLDADHAVAQGAAIQAAIKCARPNDKLLDFAMVQEVTPMSLGLEVATKEFDVIIKKGTKIPVTKEQAYFTWVDNQEDAYIRIFQGEESVAAENKLLGDFELQGIPPAKAHEKEMHVLMHIDQNGILTVEASCIGSEGVRNQMTVSAEKGIMSKETKDKKLQARKSLGRRSDLC